MAFEFVMGVINRRSWLLMNCSVQTFIPEFASLCRVVIVAILLRYEIQITNHIAARCVHSTVHPSIKKGMKQERKIKREKKNMLVVEVARKMSDSFTNGKRAKSSKEGDEESHEFQPALNLYSRENLLLVGCEN